MNIKTTKASLREGDTHDVDNYTSKISALDVELLMAKPVH